MKNIEFTRGDTFQFKFQRKDINDNVIMKKSQEMYFTVKKNYNTKDILIEKTLDNGIKFDENTGFYVITIDSSDTEDLKYKTYFWDIQVVNDGVVETIAKKREMKLTEEVTFRRT